MSKTIKKKGQGGFTLIELLIVIGLLGALVGLVLPRLTADREEALEGVDDYNQAGTLRTLSQFNQITGEYPADLHTGLDDIVVASADAMGGIPDGMESNLVDLAATTIVGLTANQATSLSEAGITSIAYSNGLNTASVAADVAVARCTAAWVDEDGNALTFDGRDITAWEADTSAGIVVALFVAPTTDWDKVGDGEAGDWTGGNVQIGLDLEGKCPIPTESIGGGAPDFSYYVAYLKVYDNGDAAELVGTSCPEATVLNP
jgi:prepilin-type N-terminal cleavage/methylation domain-containing protein